jgi:hypothetical protein
MVSSSRGVGLSGLLERLMSRRSNVASDIRHLTVELRGLAGAPNHSSITAPQAISRFEEAIDPPALHIIISAAPPTRDLIRVSPIFGFWPFSALIVITDSCHAQTQRRETGAALCKLMDWAIRSGRWMSGARRLDKLRPKLPTLPPDASSEIAGNFER